MFILAGIAELYKPQKDDHGDPRQGPPRPQLDLLKGEAWDLLVDLRGAAKDVVDNLEPATVDFLNWRHRLVRPVKMTRLLANPADFAVTYKAEFQTLFDTYSTKLVRPNRRWQRQTVEGIHHTHEWLVGRRQAGAAVPLSWVPALGRDDLPHAVFDPGAATDPDRSSAVQSADGDRNSIRSRRSRSAGGRCSGRRPSRVAPTKLKGIPVSHFAGFFSAKSRENDYLWGRLDAAELILRLLQDVGDVHGYRRKSGRHRMRPASAPG